MAEYPSNSNKAKELPKEKKVEKVITGIAKTQEKKGMRKFVDTLFTGDIHSVVHYAVDDVILPTLKKTIHDILVDGINIMFYDNLKPASKNTNYGSCYSEKRNEMQPKPVRGMGYEELIFNSMADAKSVIDELDELVRIYGIASVADLYSAAGLTCDYTLNNYGWHDVRDALVVRCDDGYKIKLPKAVSLRKY